MKPLRALLPMLFAITGILLTAAAVGRTQSQNSPPDMKTMMSMQATDAKLDQLVADLNAARGASVEVRVDKLTAVVNELVAERKTMRGMMGMMHGGMQSKDDHHPPESRK